MGIEFKFFEAGHGDSILVSTYEKNNDEEKEYKTHILIDGGVEATYNNEILSEVTHLEKLDLVVLTHIDNDHICGLIELLKDTDNREKIKELWFNMPSEDLEISSIDETVNYGQGNLFNYLLEKEPKINHINNVFVENKPLHEIGDTKDIELTLLSPMEKNLLSLKKQWDKDDNKKLRDCKGREFMDVARSEPPIDKREIGALEATCINGCDNFFGKETSVKNKSSIAFILKYQNKNFLLLGDADIKVVIQSLKDLGYRKEDDKRLEVEFVKLSHHGSANNINSEFLDLVKTDTYIILTDGSHPNKSTYRHPDKETLALILTHKKRAENIKFMFNTYLPIKNKFPDELNEENQYKFKSYKRNIWRRNYDS